MQKLAEFFNNNDIFRVLRIRSFLALMVSEFFSQLAFNMQHFVFIFLMYEATKSNTAVSGVILSFTIPAILFSVLAGVFVDRWNKKKVLIVTNFVRGLLLIPFLIPNLHVGFILGLTFLIAVVTQFFLPAESAIIPLLVPKRLIVSANAVFALGIYSTVLLGYIFSGPALLLFGKETTIIGLSILFFLGTVAAFFVRYTNKTKRHKSALLITVRKSFMQEVHEAVRFARSAKKVTNALIILTLSQAIVFTFAVLGPGYVSTILNVQVESLSWILLAPAAFGMIIGSLLLGSFGGKYKGPLIISIGIFISGCVFFFLPFGSKVASQGFIHTLNVSLPRVLDVTMIHIIEVLAFTAGIANAMIFIPSNASIQLHTSPAMRGRIYGFLNALVGGVSLLPVAAAGGLADIFGVSGVITTMGIMLILAGFTGIFSTR